MSAELMRESLRGHRRSLLWWSFGLLLLVGIIVAFYPSTRDASGLNDYAKELPKAVRGLFAGGEVDFTSPAGYLNSQLFALMVPLLLLIFSIGFGAGAIAGEEEHGFLDFLLAQPVPREIVVLARVAALAALCAALGAVLFVATVLGDAIVGLDVGVGAVLAATFSAVLLALLFGVLALTLGAWLPGRARAISISAALATAAWLVDGLGQVVDALDVPRAISPYRRLIGVNPLSDGAPWAAWLGTVALIAAFAIAASVLLRRRDVLQ